MRTSFFLTAALLLALLVPASDALAQVPRTFSYQGVLANNDGTPIATGPHTLSIKIYDQPTGGTLLFSEQHTVQVVRGVFNVIVGSQTPMPATLGFDRPYYLGLTVDNGTELVPRTALTSSPYTMHSWIADSLAGGIVRSVNGQSGAVTIGGSGGIDVTQTGSTISIRDTAPRVTSLNGANGDVSFVGGGATTVTRNGNVVTITSRDSVGSGLTGVLNLDESIAITRPDGPVPLIGVAQLGVTTPKIADEAVTTAKLADISITTRKIADLAVTNPKIGPSAVTTDKIADATIITADLADASVTSAKIADGTIVTVDLADNSVTSPKILDGTIITADLADGSVTSAKIADATIATVDLADGSVTSAKIADATIVTADLADNAVTSAKIVDGTIATADIGAGAVTLAKINSTGAAAGQSVTFDGTNLVYAFPSASSLVLPFAQTATTTPTTFALTNLGTGGTGSFTVNNAASGANALSATTNGTGNAVLGVHSGTTGTGAGVRGESNSNDANSAAVLGVINSTTPGGFSAALRGINNGTGGLGIGVYGSQAGSGWGVYGTTAGGIGVYGNSTNGYGLYALSTNGTGIYGSGTNGEAARFEITNSANANAALTGSSVGAGVAVVGTQSGTGQAGQFTVNNSSSTATTVGVANSGTGNGMDVSLTSPSSNATGVTIANAGIGGGLSVQLTNASNGARGVDVTQSGVGPGVFATSAGGNALWGITSSISAAGVIGDNTFGEAVVGRNRGGNGVGAVVGRNDSSGYGVRGFNTKDGIGVLGQAGISGGTGVGGRFENVNAANTSQALAVATNGIGSGITVQLTNASNGARGIDVTQSGVGPGVFATSAGGNAVWGITSSISAAGVIGDNTFGEAVVGRNRGGNGVGAVVGRNDSSGYGVRGFNTKDGIGVLGQAGISGGTGVAGRFENVNASNTNDALQVATNSSGNAARFTGNVVVNGNLTVSGTVAKGGGSFMIDHPLDPKNKILYHSFVESPDMMNIYNGMVNLDANGEAVVALPNWFSALNGDFRYQLTAIGAQAPGLFVAEEISDNHFKIAGGKPGMKVSWMVTGIRHDPYAEKHRIQVEVDKTPEQRGTYLQPDVYGVETKGTTTSNVESAKASDASGQRLTSSGAASRVERATSSAATVPATGTASSAPATGSAKAPQR